MNTILAILKADLGISGNRRDDYFTALITAVISELNGKGVDINETDTEDMILVADYAAWRYRKRETGEPMPENILLRIRNKKTKARCSE